LNSCANIDNKKNTFIQQLVEQMTLDEKVGQMTQVDKRMLDSEEDIAKFFLYLITLKIGVKMKIDMGISLTH